MPACPLPSTQASSALVSIAGSPGRVKETLETTPFNHLPRNVMAMPPSLRLVAIAFSS